MRSSARTIPRSRSSPGRLADLGYRVADVAAALAGYLADLDETGPHELAAVEERRAVLTALVRAHGSLDEAIALLDTGSARLAELDDDGDRIERLDARTGCRGIRSRRRRRGTHRGAHRGGRARSAPP